MWNDEDNNPYGSFDRHSEAVNDHFHGSPGSTTFDPPSTPQSSASTLDPPPDYVSRLDSPSPDVADSDEGRRYAHSEQSQGYPRNKGVYQSRIEQILYENPELPILITDAGKNHESGGSFIVYTIRTGDLEVRRRYSEFSSLRATLINLHPTLIIPPIPEKHTMADYAAKPTKAKEDTSIIDLRKRMLAVFLNRCRRMKEIREDGVWWRFLDPNASWNEVLHSHPASSVPKNNLKAPPLDPANPQPAHAWLPVPSSSAKLKFSAAMSPPSLDNATSSGPGNGSFLSRFPPTSRNLSEEDLDPYFVNYEVSTRELELLLQGNIEKVNRRTLTHLSSLSADLMELGARYNGFSLSEPSATVAAAIERIGQAADTSYIETEELSATLGATFAEPMRESAQFAGVVRNVLRYRILKRIQQEMTRDELSKKRALLDSLERSELEAKRIEQYLNRTGSSTTPATFKRSLSDSSAPSTPESGPAEGARASPAEDTASIDSDFPSGGGDSPQPSASQGLPQRTAEPPTATPPSHRKTSSGNFVTNKIFGRISHAVHGFVDVDPERTRRDQIGKTKEILLQLEQALEVSEKDVKDASSGVLQDLKRFQKEKENDLRRYMLTFTTPSSKRRKVAECKVGARGRPARSSPQTNNFSSPRSSTRLRRRTSNSHLSGSASALPTTATIATTAPTASSPTSPSTSISALTSIPFTTSPISSTDASNASTTLPSATTASSGPAYIPAHIQRELRRKKHSTRTPKKVRSATPGSPDTAASSPSAAYAELSLNTEPSAAAASAPAAVMAASEGMSGSSPHPHGADDVSENGRQELQSAPAVKRPAAEMGEDDRQPQDVEMGAAPSGGNEEKEVLSSYNPVSKSKKQTDRPSRHRRAVSVDMDGQDDNSMEVKHENPKSASSEDTVSSSSDSVYPTPSSMSTYTSSTREDYKPSHTQPRASHDMPSIDDQVAIVTKLLLQPLKENQKGYVVSANWLGRVLSRSSKGGLPREKVDKTASEGEIGPVDNSDLVLVTDPSLSYKDEAGELFVPLRPGLQIGEDFEVLPEDAWEMIMKWYGLSRDSPAIVRFAHDTATGTTENVQYELNPPIFTILKLPNPSQSQAQIAQDKARAPVKTLASRHTPFQQWLRNVKSLASIEMSTKVRVWRILEGLNSTATSGIITPAASRSTSPAPGATLTANAGNSLVLDVNKFVALVEGSQRELLEMKDQTANPKYNGSLTLHLAGLGGDDVIVLEEQVGGPGGGEWVADCAGKNTNHLSVSAIKAGSQNKAKAKAPATSGRASSPAVGPVTRGRQRKDGRSRGVTGLSNLGNSCYMNSALQCVRSVEELTQYFLQDEYRKDLNPGNPLSHDGNVAKAYANLLHQLFDENGTSSFAPRQFKQTIGRYGPSFSGYGQQDSQEFVLFLLDGLQEDLNRIQKKPYIEKPDSTDDMVNDNAALQRFASKCWDIYKARNDSVITDLFAGMYKSTVVCPVCDKVSIIFDPFSNLTLQLPIENLWSKELFFFPLYSRPVRLDVDIDKNSSVKALKEYVGEKVNVDTNRLVMAEIYKQKFYKMFDNTSSIADCQISASDDIGIFEVESVPTSYDPDKPPKRSSYSSLVFTSSSADQDIPPFDSPKCDRMLIPVFHRTIKSQGARISRQLFGAPSYIVVNREEAYDYDSILRKVLRNSANLTSRDFLREDDGDAVMSSSPAEDSDTVVTNDDDFDSSDPKIKVSSVDGEDGLVDVSMRDASDPSSQIKSKARNNPVTIPKVLRPGSFIPPNLRKLFEMKIMRSTDAVPTGFSSVDEIKDFTSMASRLPRKQNKRVHAKKKFASRGNSPISSEDELSGPARRVNSAHSKDGHDLDDSGSQETKDDSCTESGTDSYPHNATLLHKFGREKPKTSAVRNGPQRPIPLIRAGEGIILEWNEHAFDALFAGDPREEDSLRGSPTWMNIDCVPDPELAEKRQLRQSRKKRGVSLDECLDEFGKEEILSENDAWYCPRCKEHRRASKKFELWKCPDILVMHLKRFSANRGFRDKIDALVDFPHELDMTGRVQMPEEGKSLQYELIAVDNHYGGLGGGHYTAFAKNFFDGCWYEYNDSHVSKKTNPSAVVTSAAYLLFYRRRSDVPLGGEYLASVTRTANNQDQADSDSQTDSRQPSPSGEGQRLGGSSRSGSSSALTGAAAIHQAGDGGLRGGIQARDDDDVPEYFEHGLDGISRNHLEDMDLEDEGFDASFGPELNFSNHPIWSFDRAEVPYGPSGLVSAPANSFYDGDGDEDLDDDVSNKAVGGGDMSDSESRLAMLNDSDEPGMVFDDLDPTTVPNITH
ncbi:sorting nexin-41 [Paracoccidioides brasiliensis]|uniref:Sorting nexin-41 n=1 Tax=Paracoccidioides brasiliensis TaxID=121759 RepID=A0A1D2J7E4_PARBR|nr:sorting nexin-41 [Paracoccidioides brasiliensis]